MINSNPYLEEIKKNINVKIKSFLRKKKHLAQFIHIFIFQKRKKTQQREGETTFFITLKGFKIQTKTVDSFRHF